MKHYNVTIPFGDGITITYSEIVARDGLSAVCKARNIARVEHPGGVIIAHKIKFIEV